MIRKGLFLWGILLVFLCVAGSAWAAQTTTQIQVTGQMPQTITVSATPLDFGVFTVGTGATATATITVVAPNGTNYKIALGGGNAPVSPTTNGCYRQLKNSTGNNSILYDIYLPNNMAWGDACLPSPTYRCGTPIGGGGGVNNGDCVSGQGTGSQQQYQATGKTLNIPATLPAGTYTDTVTVTVVW